MFDLQQQTRFWSKVDRQAEDDCWLWTGAAYSDSGRTRGRFYALGRMFNAAQAACTISHGARPEGMGHLHSCDNPMCCNPSHLRWGTHAENMADMKARKRHPVFYKEYCKYGHPLSGDNLQVLKNRPGRSCKTCQRRRKLESMQRRAAHG